MSIACVILSRLLRATIDARGGYRGIGLTEGTLENVAETKRLDAIKRKDGATVARKSVSRLFLLSLSISLFSKSRIFYCHLYIKATLVGRVIIG
jgi:hypothetical protein